MIATHSMQNLVANFSGRTRRERVGGRDYLVVPMTMIVPGVLNGSRGPILYDPDEVAASTPYWHGTILTDDHLDPAANGNSIAIQEQYALGRVQNPFIQNGRLKAEGWFDIERTRRINSQILNALLSGKKIELSTGLKVEFDDRAGVHNGKPYHRIARKYRPDHLAILINDRGACSVQDGCGINNCDNNSPAGGSLGMPAIDWGAPTTTSPMITRQSVSISRSGGPAGGSLGGLPVIDFDRQPEPEREQQPSRPTYEDRDGPAGGALGPAPTPTY